MVINQGDIFCINLGDPSGSGPGYRHPCVVIQNNVFNRSRLNTVVVCGLTSNLRRAKAPGNVFIKIGEANLPKQSVVNVTQIFTIDKTNLKDKIGKLSSEKVRRILHGIKLVMEPREIEP